MENEKNQKEKRIGELWIKRQKLKEIRGFFNISGNTATELEKKQLENIIKETSKTEDEISKIISEILQTNCVENEILKIMEIWEIIEQCELSIELDKRSTQAISILDIIEQSQLKNKLDKMIEIIKIFITMKQLYKKNSFAKAIMGILEYKKITQEF